MASPLMRDARGYEAQFATNHLGHFQLTARLWPALKRANGARVVSLSSIGHRRAPVNLEDPNFERTEYNKWDAYGRAKSANSLFAIGLDKRGAPHNVRAFAVHPGGIMTDLQRFMPEEEKRAMGWIDADGKVNERFKTTSQGAATSVWCATNAQLDGQGRRLLRGLRHRRGRARGHKPCERRAPLGDRSRNRGRAVGAQREDDRCALRALAHGT